MSVQPRQHSLSLGYLLIWCVSLRQALSNFERRKLVIPSIDFFLFSQTDISEQLIDLNFFPNHLLLAPSLTHSLLAMSLSGSLHAAPTIESKLVASECRNLLSQPSFVQAGLRFSQKYSSVRTQSFHAIYFVAELLKNMANNHFR